MRICYLAAPASLKNSPASRDRQAARRVLTMAALTGLARRRLAGDTSREHAIRHAEIRRVALACARQAASWPTTASN
jgi:hypothetical protein